MLKIKSEEKKFPYIAENVDDAVDTICVFPVLSSAAKDLSLAPREEGTWERV